MSSLPPPGHQPRDIIASPTGTAANHLAFYANEQRLPGVKWGWCRGRWGIWSQCSLWMFCACSQKKQETLARHIGTRSKNHPAGGQKSHRSTLAVFINIVLCLFVSPSAVLQIFCWSFSLRQFLVGCSLLDPPGSRVPLLWVECPAVVWFWKIILEEYILVLLPASDHQLEAFDLGNATFHKGKNFSQEQTVLEGCYFLFFFSLSFCSVVFDILFWTGHPSVASFISMASSLLSMSMNSLHEFVFNKWKTWWMRQLTLNDLRPGNCSERRNASKHERQRKMS